MEKPLELVENPAPNVMPSYDPEIDTQIATARRFPRAIGTFHQRATTMATVNQETAESCFYKLPRGKGMIEGPGVRLAEIIAAAYQNMRFGARVIREDDRFIYAQGLAFDLENNTSASVEVRRRITDKYGKKYNDDMIAVTANAACSIAFRNAIFKIIPKSLVDPIYEEAKKVAIGTSATLKDRRGRALDYFTQKLGIAQEKVLEFLERDSVEDVDLEDLEILTGLKTGIKDGDVTLEQLFGAQEKTNGRVEKVKNLIKEKRKARK